MSEIGRGRVVVRGSNIMLPPLLETDKAAIIEFRDQFNDLHALFCRVLSEDMWGLVTKDDPDWNGTLIRYGYLSNDKKLEQLIRGG